MGAAPDEPEEPRYNACSAAPHASEGGDTARARLEAWKRAKAAGRSGSPTIEQEPEPSAKRQRVDDDNEPRCRFLRITGGLAAPELLRSMLEAHGTVEEVTLEKEGCVVEMSCTREATAGKRALDGAVVGGVAIEVAYDHQRAEETAAAAAEALQADKKRRRDAEADAALEREAARREAAEEEALYGPAAAADEPGSQGSLETADADAAPAKVREKAHPLAGDRAGKKRATREVVVDPRDINIVPVPKAAAAPGPSYRSMAAAPEKGPAYRSLAAEAEAPRARYRSMAATSEEGPTYRSAAPSRSARAPTGVELADRARDSPDPEADAAHARLAAWKKARAEAAAGGGPPEGPRSLAEQWQEEQGAEKPPEKPKFRPGYSHPLAAETSETAKRSTKPPTRGL